MRPRTILGLFLLALAISLGTNVYLYLTIMQKQKIVNNIRAEIIVEWASRMDIAARYLKNVTTNIDVAEKYGVRYYLLSAYQIMKIALIEQGDDWSLYEPFWSASIDVAGNLIGYEEGAQVAPVVERHINSTAIEMFGNLADKIQNVTALIFKADEQALARLNGDDPMQLLEEVSVRDDVIQGCLDIRYYSLQIAEFNPKFQ